MDDQFSSDFDKTDNRVSGLVQNRPENPGFLAFRLPPHKKRPQKKHPSPRIIQEDCN